MSKVRNINSGRQGGDESTGDAIPEIPPTTRFTVTTEERDPSGDGLDFVNVERDYNAHEVTFNQQGNLCILKEYYLNVAAPGGVAQRLVICATNFVSVVEHKPEAHIDLSI